MSQPVVTCIPTYDKEPRYYLKSVSTGLYLVGRDDGTFATSSTCNVNALWGLESETGSITWRGSWYAKYLVYGLNWQDIGLSYCDQNDTHIKLISINKSHASGKFEMQCPALQIRLACSSNGEVKAVSINDEGSPEECQWETKLASGELCFICCKSDHTRLAYNEAGQVCFTSVDPSMLKTKWCPTTIWRFVECGDGTVEIFSYDYQNYLALVNGHHVAFLTGSAANDSNDGLSFAISFVMVSESSPVLKGSTLAMSEAG